MNLRNIKNWIISLVIAFGLGGAIFTAMIPQTISAAAPTTSCAKRFLGFPVWYRGLTVSDADCNIQSPSSVGLGNFIWHIALNIIEMAMMAVGYIAVAFILYGGFQYLTSQGTPDAAAKARTTITNAIIGLVISIVAVAVVDFIFAGLKI